MPLTFRLSGAPGRRRRPEVYWQAHGAGTPLVLINGYAASAAAWPRTWLRGLESRFRVIAVDNRGGGWSRFAEAPFTMTDLAGDVEDVLDECEHESAIVLGLSMGGMVAQELAMRSPERVSALALVATRPPIPHFHPPSLLASVDLMRPVMPGEPLEDYFTRLWTRATGPGFAAEHPELIAEMTRASVERPTPRGALLSQFRAMSGWAGAGGLATLDIPTVVVHGSDDRFSPVENGRELRDLIPGADYRELDGVGHLVPMEAPAALDEAIDAVAARAAAKSRG